MEFVSQALALADRYHRGGEQSLAEQLCRQILHTDAAQTEAWYLLGLACLAQMRLDEAAEHFRQVLRLKPDHAEAHSKLGAVLLARQERLDEAGEHLRQALRLKPDLAMAHSNLGLVLELQGRLDGAVASFRQALRLRPDYPEGLSNLGNTLLKLGKPDEAVDYCQQALRLRPDYPEALCNLGNALSQQGRLDEAVASYRQGLRLRPDFAKVYSNLGDALVKQGKPEEAVVCLRHAVHFKPDLAGAHSNLLFALNYDPAIDPPTLFAEHCRWADQHARCSALPPADDRNRDPHRRLRVGYVCPDLCRHTVACFFEPILAHHDSAAIEAVCYAEVLAPDSMTARLRALSRGWHFTSGWTDAQLADTIRRDAIDILVDLAGHTANNRLAAFAYKPAPVQVTYLGYPNTTGLSTIDYRLTDRVADPPGEPALHTEELVRLPGIFCCYAPMAGAPDVTPLPARQTGRFTFGSLHPLARLNGAVLDLWCDLLRATPTSRLLVFRDSLVGEARDALRRKFHDRGITPDRIELGPSEATTPFADYRAIYGSVDVSLDTFPWSGHTLACESLWMGVPIITLCGARHAGRMVSSVLHGVGLQDWVARTPEEYVAKAVQCASDWEALARLRAGLRQRIQASALCDGGTFTNELEGVYRQMWQRWCARREELSHQIDPLYTTKGTD